MGDETELRIGDRLKKLVAFLVTDRYDKEVGRLLRKPIGTAFFIIMRITNSLFVSYAVTARHVVEGSREDGMLYIRLNTRDGSYKDFEAPQNNWVLHSATDVAVTPVAFPPDIDWATLPNGVLATDEFIKQHEVGIGDEVFFLGLFSEYYGQETNQPIARFGNISLMPSEKIPVKLDPHVETKTLIDAYLVEARSWGGLSGSPAFVYFSPERQFGRPPQKIGIDMLTGKPVFVGTHYGIIGLVHGHWGIKQEIKDKYDSLGEVDIPINAGIVVVVPSQKIIEVLMTEELMKEREAARNKNEKTISTPKADISEDTDHLTKDQFHIISYSVRLS